MFGVSPAYFLSLFSSDFSISQVEASLPRISELGFTHVELETFSRGQLHQWNDEIAETFAERIHASGLRVSQFVGHHLLKHFACPSLTDIEELCTDFKKITQIVSKFEGLEIITIPQPAFSCDWGIDVQEYKRIINRFRETLLILLDMAARDSLVLALEVLPGSLVGNSDGFLSLSESLGASHLGFNFDTGHAWASKEAISLIPFKLGKRIVCTHLSDNHGYENLSLAPGRGTVPWSDILAALKATGYSGSFDIEIRCSGEDTEKEYSSARNFLYNTYQEVLEVHHAPRS